MAAYVFATGIAEVRIVKGLQVQVACPHCFQLHTHSRTVVGSRSVVAGCHVGFRRCREYSVPETAMAARVSRPKVRAA